MIKILLMSIVLVLAVSTVSEARGHRSGPYYGGGHHSESHGGNYNGGHGRSHKGGKYRNGRTGNHYGRHK